MNSPQAQVSTTGDEPTSAQLDDLLRQLAEMADAVAARDTFIAVAAHELRNPITPIVGQIELLLTALRAGRCAPAETIERLVRVQQTMRRYVKRAVVLLDVSRITSGHFQLEPAPCDLASIVREVADDFTEAAQHAGTVVTVAAPPSAPGSWDRLAVEQVLDNLLSNAIKYGARTPVHVSLEAAEGGEVRITVRDHGNGIAAVDRARVFERFERVVGQTEYRSGFGVGLWVVGKLVAAMNGRIAIDDATDGGAVFIVTLPAQLQPS